MTPKTPGVPLCELKGWPVDTINTSPLTMNDYQITATNGRNMERLDLGQKRLTVDVEAYFKMRLKEKYPKGLPFLPNHGHSLAEAYPEIYRESVDVAKYLDERLKDFIHLSDGEGNDERN